MTRPLIVLDMDDTLYLERDYVLSGFLCVAEEVRRRFGIEGVDVACWQLFQKGVRGTVFDAVIRSTPGMSGIPGILQLMVEVYRTHRPSINLQADALAFLENASKVADLALITDGPPVSQRAKIDALGLDRWISKCVVTSEKGVAWTKPSLLPFRLVQTFFNAAPEACVYIADNPLKDFEAPRALGWHAVRVHRIGGLHYSVDNGPWPQLVVEDLDPLTSLAPLWPVSGSRVANGGADGRLAG